MIPALSFAVIFGTSVTARRIRTRPASQGRHRATPEHYAALRAADALGEYRDARTAGVRLRSEQVAA